jgi:hypothetical protein
MLDVDIHLQGSLSVSESYRLEVTWKSGSISHYGEYDTSKEAIADGQRALRHNKALTEATIQWIRNLTIPWVKVTRAGIHYLIDT